jgi:hypothetical protein
MFFLSSPSFDANYDGVLGSPSSSIRVPSSSSTRAPSFYLTNASWFALYFKIGNLYSSSSGSLYSLVTFCVWFLPMNIGLFYLSSTNILLGVINAYCSFDLLVQLAMDYPLELVSSCSQNMGQTSISQWHTLCIPSCYFSMPNIPF